jgi:hypothetical protein
VRQLSFRSENSRSLHYARLRFAPVGMTNLSQSKRGANSRVPLEEKKRFPCNKFVIPTGAKRSGGTCCTSYLGMNCMV